jgi:hypothetical protein
MEDAADVAVLTEDGSAMAVNPAWLQTLPPEMLHPTLQQ